MQVGRRGQQDVNEQERDVGALEDNSYGTLGWGAPRRSRVLWPSCGPTQTMATPRLVFRAVVVKDGGAEIAVAL